MSGASQQPVVDDACAAIDAALDVLAGVEFAGLPVASSPELVDRLAVLQRRLDAVALGAVRAFDAAGGWKLDGAASAQAWLRAHLRVTPGAARRVVRTARRLPELSELGAALRAGEIDRAHVEVVTRAMEATPQRRESIAAAEPVFCEAARRLDPAQLSRVVTRWTHTVDPLGAVEEERAVHAQRFVSASRTFEGAVRIDGLLGPEQGAVVLSALEAVSTMSFRDARASAGDDERSAGQRRADALTDLCRRFLDDGVAPEVGGMRPQVQVTVPLEALAAAPEEAGYQGGELEGVGPVSAEAARRVSCDALLTALGLDRGGTPLALGRTRRTVDGRMRKALNHRDGGCRFPGCGRPVAWCQAHHIVHWSRGGPTDARNLVLLCSFHHHLVHEGGFTASGDAQEGTFTVRRPDGTRLRDPEREERTRGPGARGDPGTG